MRTMLTGFQKKSSPKHSSLFFEYEDTLLRKILTSSSDPILITTKDSKIVYVNPAWEKITGYKFLEVSGKNPNLLQSGKTPHRVYKKMWNSLPKMKPFTSDEFIDKKKNGTFYHIRSSMYPVTFHNEILYYVQIQYDITTKKRLDELRKEFLSAAAHELKTPITVLKLLTQSHLQRAADCGTDTIKASELELIDRELDYLVQIINDMLDSSRFETGKQFLEFEEVDLVKLVNKAVTKIQIFAKNHLVRVDNNPKKALVIADPVRIKQVLLNLLSNAAKYSPAGSSIVVSIIKKGENYVVSVKDEGIGIPKNKLKLVFDRYYQVKTKSKKGFGLGLYISKEIVKLHKGKIWVESTKGKGSTFFFSLPIKKIIPLDNN